MPPGRRSLVERIARRVARTLPPSFDLEDLTGVGNIALVHAAEKYRPGEHGGAPFLQYAWRVISGAILESVRRNKYLENTRPRSRETAATGSHPAQLIDQRRQCRRVSDAISWLPERERQVLQQRYAPSEPTVKQVGERLNMKPSAVRALQARAIAALKIRLHAAA